MTKFLSQWAVSGENVFGKDRTLIKLCKTLKMDLSFVN